MKFSSINGNTGKNSFFIISSKSLGKTSGLPPSCIYKEFPYSSIFYQTIGENSSWAPLGAVLCPSRIPVMGNESKGNENIEADIGFTYMVVRRVEV